MMAEKISQISATSASSLSDSAFRGSSGYYTYTSPPRVVHGKLKRYRNNLPRPRGVHDYYNMMWDPHIYRGKATTTNAGIPSKNKLGDNESENKVGDGNATSVGDNKYKKKRTSYYTSSTTTNGGGNGLNRNRYKITTRVTTKTKGLNKLVAPIGERQHTHVQTEQFLEDLTGDMEIDENDAFVQTDPIHEFPIRHKRDSDRYITTKNGVDACTQVLPGELAPFDEEVQPVVEALVGKILQQSLLETMEEEELAALKEQQNRFHEKRRQEEKLLRELQEQQERITQEKERLKLQLLEGGFSSGSNNPLIQENVILDEAIRTASINQPSIPTSYLIELLPSVLNSLRQEGFLSDNVGDDLFQQFQPMWRSSSKAESDVGEPITGVSSGSVSVDPEDASKLNVTAERPEEDEGEESAEDKDDNQEDNVDVDEDDETHEEDDQVNNNEDLNTTVEGTSEQSDDDNFNTLQPSNLHNINIEPGQLPNGRIGSFERAEGSVIEGEVK